MYVLLNRYKALISNVLQLKKALSTEEIDKFAGHFFYSNGSCKVLRPLQKVPQVIISEQIMKKMLSM